MITKTIYVAEARDQLGRFYTLTELHAFVNQLCDKLAGSGIHGDDVLIRTECRLEATVQEHL